MPVVCFYTVLLHQPCTPAAATNKFVRGVAIETAGWCPKLLQVRGHSGVPRSL